MPFSFLEYLFFCFRDIYVLIWESDNFIVGSTKIVQHSIRNISRNIKAVSSKLIPLEMYTAKETK